MSNWMEGYASSDVYTKGAYRELNPNLAIFSLLSAGIRPPIIRRACELGFGYGMSLNHFASTQKIDWYGNDFDPKQKNFAQNLCTNSENGAVLTDSSFSQLTEYSGWPKFEFISLHGIWCWISQENQENILRFVSDHLSDDGILYISYNTSPGCQTFQPIRELMKHKFENGTRKSDGLEIRIKETIAYIQEFCSSGGHYLANNEQVARRIAELNSHTPAYILHEYMNDFWNVESFYSIKEKLSKIKLDFVCSSSVKNSLNSLNYTDKQVEFLNTIKDVSDREFVSDLYWAETFRKDYWVKGPNQISNQERYSALEKIQVIQCLPREDISSEFTGRAASGSIENELYDSVMDFIEKSDAVSLKDLSETISGITLEATIEVVRVLISLGFIQLVTSDEFIGSKDSLESALKMNDAICRESVRSENSVNYLCSPRTGDSLLLTRITLIYLHARNTGYETFESACLAVVKECAKNNETFQSDGIALSEEKDAHNYVMREVGAVIEKFGPVYLKHGVKLER